MYYWTKYERKSVKKMGKGERERWRRRMIQKILRKRHVRKGQQVCYIGMHD